jgi:enterochelin esterase family protein
MPENTVRSLAAGQNGVWSLTVGPLSPDLYLYAFSVDGVRIADPSNRQVKNGYPGISSLLEVPGPEADFLACRNVPHGVVHIHTYYSRASQTIRNIHVYTPPGYNPAGSRRYPTLYLLHGSWDTDADWSGVGRAGIILDNLIAQHRAAEMLLVMPDGHPYPSFEVFTRPRNLALLSQEVIEELIPMIERTYRASPRAADRAIAGCSMGGTQALHIGLSNLSRFGSIGAMSAPGNVPASEPFLVAQAGVLKDVAGVNSRLHLLWLSCGREDALKPRAAEVHDILAAAGIRHIWRETNGAHNWTVWRRQLLEILLLLFR